MDIFINSEYDALGLGTKFAERGIYSVGQNDVRGSGRIWYEECGIYIETAKIFIIELDDRFWKCEACFWATEQCFHDNVEIILVICTTEYEKNIRMFKEKWGDKTQKCEYFSELNGLLDYVCELLIDNDSFSSLELKLNAQLNAFLIEDAKRTAFQCLNHKDLRNQDIINDSIFPELRIRQYLAEIYFTLDELNEFEEEVRTTIARAKAYHVLGSDLKWYFWQSVLEYYLINIKHAEDEAIAVQEDKKMLVAKIGDNTICNLGAIDREYKLFIERCLRRRRIYLKKSEIAVAEDYRVIADYLRSSIELFDKLGNVAGARDYWYCIEQSYARLLEYSKLINDTELIKMCIDAMEKIRNRPLPENGNTETGLLNTRCLKAFLGIELPTDGCFDAFISHKSADTELASEVYDFLKQKGKEVFFDRDLLPKMQNSEYRDSILVALDNSSHLIIVCSDLAYISTGWVKDEYNLFCDELRAGRKNGNIILVFTDELSVRVKANSKKDLPIQLRQFEIMDMKTFRSRILDYIY